MVLHKHHVTMSVPNPYWPHSFWPLGFWHGLHCFINSTSLQLLLQFFSHFSKFQASIFLKNLFPLIPHQIPLPSFLSQTPPTVSEREVSLPPLQRNLSLTILLSSSPSSSLKGSSLHPNLPSQLHLFLAPFLASTGLKRFFGTLYY